MIVPDPVVGIAEVKIGAVAAPGAAAGATAGRSAGAVVGAGATRYSSAYAWTFCTYACVSAYGGTPFYRWTAPGPALWAASAFVTSPPKASSC